MDPEPKSEGNGQEPPNAPQVGTGNGQEPPATAVPASDPDARAAELSEARREAARERSEKKKLADQLAAIEREKLSETERTRKDLETAQAALTTALDTAKAARLENALLRQASKVNIRPDAHDAALKLIDATLLDWDEATGSYTEASVTKALKALIERHPFLVAAPDARQPAPAPAGFAPQGSAVNGAQDEQGRKNQASISGRW